MTRADRLAMTLACTWIAAVGPAFFHHYLPAACWLTGWIVLLATKEERHG